MSLESLIDELRRRGEAEVGEVATARDRELREIVADREHRVEAVRRELLRHAESEAARERAQRVAAAKLQSRKLVYEARETRLAQSLEETRELLREYTESPQYPATLRRMVQVATEALGKSIRVMGRTEDASRLAKAAGRAFDAAPVPILGGLVAETTDGSRRLNLSFDELLRLREDRVRELLS